MNRIGDFNERTTDILNVTCTCVYNNLYANFNFNCKGRRTVEKKKINILQHVLDGEILDDFIVAYLYLHHFTFKMKKRNFYQRYD